MCPLRLIAGLLALLCALALAREYLAATDFPTAQPVKRVDAGFVAYLRGNPGLHLALAEDAVFEVDLDLREDTWNRSLFGTSLELREIAPRSAIHIQRKGERLAIHADNFNPAAGLGYWLLHVTLDVPVIPLVLGLVLTLFVAVRRKPRFGTRPRASSFGT